jgi:putative endonuclease
MHYYVYIMTSPTWTTFYIGVTDDLERRVCEHKQKVKEGFTRRYNLTLLAYFEEGDEVAYAIGREKQ